MSQPARDNPYAPPSSPVGERVAPPAPEELATHRQRFANYMIDGVFSGIATFAVVIFAVATEVVDLENPPETSFLVDYLFGGLTILVYYLPFEAVTGRTPAKLITGTRVVDASGEPAGFAQILGRTLSRIVPFEPFSFLSGVRPVGWHDHWSGTRVVRTRGARPLIGQYRGDGPTSPRSAG